MRREEARRAVAAAARRLAAEGLLVGTAGNVSVRLDGDDAGLVAVTATGIVLERATDADVTIVDLAGVVVDGDLAPTSELSLHLALLTRPDVAAVVHTHSPVGTALSLVLAEIPVVHYQQLVLGGSVPVVPFSVFGTPELAADVAHALRDRRAALMANHGTVAIADDLGTAVEHAVLLEWIAALYWRAAAIGEPRTLSDDEQRTHHAQVARLGYGAPRPVG